MKEKIEETICRAPPPRRRGGQHLNKDELEKEGKKPTCKQRVCKTKNQGEYNKGKKTGRPKPKAPSRWRRQFVVGVV